MTWTDDDGYQEDPDAAPTVEGRIDQASGELRKLLRASVMATIAIGTLIAVLDAWKGNGFVNTQGFLAGAGAATMNLWLLAGGFFALMRGKPATPRALIAFGMSFLGLVLLCIFVVLTKREWTLGFAVGLTTPALAGILYGRTLKQSP